MLINKWMSKPVIMVEKDASLVDVSNLFKTKIISMLPVVDEGSLVGIVTDGDIKKASPSEATTLDIYELTYLVNRIKVKSLMSSPVITIPYNFTVDEAAAKMLRNNISGMPVMGEDGSMVGIITKSDIFRSLVSFVGGDHKGQMFAVTLKDRPGIVQELTAVFREHKGRIHSIMTSYEGAGKGLRKIVIYTFDLAPNLFDQTLLEIGKIGEVTYAADQMTGKRIVFK